MSIGRRQRGSKKYIDSLVKRRKQEYDITITFQSTVDFQSMFDETHLDVSDRLKLLWRIIRACLEKAGHTEVVRVRVFTKPEL
jgi:hypothetical protein